MQGILALPICRMQRRRKKKREKKKKKEGAVPGSRPGRTSRWMISFLIHPCIFVPVFLIVGTEGGGGTVTIPGRGYWPRLAL